MAKQTKFTRRRFLQGLGVTSVLVVGGGVWRAADQGVFSAGSGPAYEPWESWRDEAAEGPMALVQASILAANPHNSQPWRFEVMDDRIDLFADTSRHLGAMDPYLREMHIGLGCAVENMMSTAAATGYAVDLTLHEGTLAGPTDEPELEPVATLQLTATEPQPSALYKAIPNRHTNRYSYAERSVEPETLRASGTLAKDKEIKLFLVERGDAAFEQLTAETIRATEWIIADDVMIHDSNRWIDRSWDELQREKDGPYIDVAGVPPLTRAFVKMMPAAAMTDETLDNGWLGGTRTSLAATPVLGLLAVRDLYDKPQTLRAGQLWQRMHLWATDQGLAMQPINQTPEVVDRQRQLEQEPLMAQFLDGLTGDPLWRPTFAFRLGHPINQPLPSARRSVAEVLV